MTTETKKVRKIKQISTLEHAKTKGMWVGSQDKQDILMHIFKKSGAVFKSLKFVPAAYKIIDEIIVNAIDHWVNYKNSVSFIKINIDSGMISVHNDGPGIDTSEVETVDGRRMSGVQMIASEFLSGDNLDSNEDRITGGTNGAGLKLTNAFSDYLKVETWDDENKKYYSQEFKNRLLVIEKPKILDKPPKGFTGTRISFMPCFKELNTDIKDKETLETYKTLVKNRACQTAAFVDADVYFNDKKLNIDFTKFADAIVPGNVIVDAGGWKVAVGPSDGKFRHVSLVNGIYVYNGGTHIDFLKEQLISYMKPKIEKAVENPSTRTTIQTQIAHNLHIVMKGFIPNPNFTAQIKDKIDSAKTKFDKHKLSDKQLESVWKVIKDSMIDSITDGNKEKKVRAATRGDLMKIPKFDDAEFAGTAKAKNTTLLICEGESAKGTVSIGISSKKLPFGPDYYGIFLSGGVPMNARSEVSVTKSGRVIRSDKLKNNERLSSLMKVLRLDVNATYESDKEFNKLRYGCVVVATDQDEDGKGNIFGLILNFFILFWPALIERGYLKRLNTPIVRAKLNKQYHDFYTVYQYEQWLKTLSESARNSVVSKYFKGLGSHEKRTVPGLFSEYKKLLVNISMDEDAQTNIEAYYGKDTDKRKSILSTPVNVFPEDIQNISVSQQLETDTKSYQRYNNLRKLPHVLDGMIPVRRKNLFTARKLFGNSKKMMKMPLFISRMQELTHYHHGEDSATKSATKMAQSFPTMRNLPMLYPGGQFGTRRAGGTDFAAARYIFTRLNYDLCTTVYPIEDDDFLKYTVEEDVVCEPYAYNPIVPMAILENMSVPGNGWRVRIWARDFWQVLKIVRDAIADEKTLEHIEEPKFWLNGFNPKIREKRSSNGKTQIFSIGRYKYNPETRILTITELPHEQFSDQYTKVERSAPTAGKPKSGAKSKTSKTTKSKTEPKTKSKTSAAEAESSKEQDEWKAKKMKEIEQSDGVKRSKYSLLKPERIMYIEDGGIRDKTTDEEVKIEILLKQGAFEEISRTYGNDRFNSIVHWLSLKTTMDSQMNMMTETGEIKNFATCADIIRHWYPTRKQMYGLRISRQIIITRLNIIKLENEIKFSGKHREYKIHDISEEDANKKLEENGYVRIDTVKLNNNRGIDTKVLEKQILKSEKSDYDYIMRMSYKTFLSSACRKRETQLKKLKAELEKLLEDNEPGFPGRRTWLAELAKLETIVKEGLANQWGTLDTDSELF